MFLWLPFIEGGTFTPEGLSIIVGPFECRS